jgi:TolB-like protein/class 3 adenylate cyclase
MKSGGTARIERRLAGILAADVAGYSRLMGGDEEGTHERLKAHLKDVVNPSIAEHRGRIVKNTGDGMLAEFSSVVDAVRCAIEVQRGMVERNAKTPQGERIAFRMGINLGDVIVEPGDIYGDGVNIAARLEALAEPGGICVSRVVRDQVRDKLNITFDDLGEQHVKNIARPIRVFAVHLTSESATAVQAKKPELDQPEKPSLAVLPFQNLSPDPGQEYFVDGVVEEITTAISRLPWLFVIARNSSFAYKGKALDVKQVARELGVRYVLGGSVRTAGNRVRITGQLVDATTGSHIWVDRFDGVIDDIFELQDRVAASVVGAIEPRLRRSEIERTLRKPRTSLGAYDLYLRALARRHRYTAEDIAESVALAREALAIAPSYAPAAAFVSWCVMLQRIQGWGACSDEDVADATSLAHKALELGRDDPDTLWQAGFTLFMLLGDAAIAAATVDRALTLHPNGAGAWQAKGMILALRNQSDPAIEAFERAQRLSPFDPLNYLSATGSAMAHLTAGRFEQAIEWADRALHDQPRMVTAMRVKVVALAHLGHLDAARAELSRALVIDPKLTIAGFREYAHFAAPEVLELFVTGLRLAGLPET